MRVLEQKRVTAISVNVLVVIILMKQQKKGDYITEFKIIILGEGLDEGAKTLELNIGQLA